MIRSVHSPILPILLGLCLLVSSWATTPLSPEDVVSLKSVGEVAISPDGKQIAYTLRVPRQADDPPGGAYQEIWLVDASSQENRRLTMQKASSGQPAWRPDGQWLTFLARRGKEKHTQIYALSLKGGEAWPLTRAENNVLRYAWSPDGQWIAFTMRDPTGKEEKERKKKGQDWEVFEQEYKHTRLWLLNVGTGEQSLLTEDDMTVWQFTWAPNSRELIFTASEKPFIDYSYMFKKIYRLDIENKKAELLIDPQAKIGHLAVSPGGDYLAYLAGVDLYDPSSGTIFVLDLRSKKVQNLSKAYPATHTWVDWWSDRTVVASAIEGVQTQLLLWDVQKGNVRPVTRIAAGGPVWSQVSFHRSSRRFAVNGSTPTSPPEVFLLTAKGQPEQLTQSNPWLRDRALGRQMVIEWKARDGLNIQGILILPVNFVEGKRYPLIVQVHGGPESAYLNGWNTYYSRWSQLLAGKGYLVLAPNYRASIGRGVEFAKMDHRDLGGAEFTDVLDGIRFLVEEKGWADRDRVGIGGGSYGGYFSAWAATRYSQHFAASVVFAGISNWISFTGTTDIPHEISLVHWAIYWHERPENERLYWERSPLAHIRNARTPTLIAHGERDLRVPISQGHELYRALQLRNIPVEFVIYPREPHGLREREHQLDFIQRVLSWYDRYVKEAERKARKEAD